MNALSRLRSLAIVALTALTALPPHAARAQDLTLDQTRALGADLIAAGELDAAGRVTRALLDRDPDDAVALILAARLASTQGDLARTADLAARAFGAAEDPDTRFVAARLAARASFELDRYTRSQIWLRRARQLAPNAVEAEAIAEDFQTVRRLNPLSLDLRFGVRPSSNINNGSLDDTSFVDFGLVAGVVPLSRDAQALSGLAFELGGTARYRLTESETATTFVDVALDGTTYALSPGARDELEAEARDKEATAATANPGNVDSLLDAAESLRDVEGSDFAFVQLSFGVSHRRVLGDGAAPTSFNARIGQTWYGGSPYTQFLDASVGQSVVFGDRSLLRLFAGAQKTFEEETISDSFSLRTGATLSRVVERGDIASFTLSGRVSHSDNSNREYSSVLAAVDYAVDQPVFGLGLAFGASVERRSWDFYTNVGGARTDETVSLTAEAEIGQVEYYGFRPVAQLEISRTQSEIALFERNYVSLGFDLRSAF